MDRFSVFVDAGYFFAAGAHAITTTATSRRNISLVSAQNIASALQERAAAQSSTPHLLRIYWYDAVTGPRPSLEQSSLAHLAGVKLRLGSLNNAGEQKGVDSLIVTDMIELARNRAISDAVLISGDEDLRIAVQLAQTFGVRVHILGVGSAANNVSPTLRMESDSFDVLDADWLKAHLHITDPEPLKSIVRAENAPTMRAETTLDEAAHEVSLALLSETDANGLAELNTHFKVNTTIPPEYDRKLIAKTAKALGGRRLASDEMRRIRGVFVTTVRTQVKPGE